MSGNGEESNENNPTGDVNETSMETPPRKMRLKLDRAVSVIKDEFTEFIGYAPDYEKKLQQRRKLVHGRRYGSKTEPASPISLGSSRTAGKAPVAKLAADGIKTIQKKTKDFVRSNSKSQDKSAAPVDETDGTARADIEVRRPMLYSKQRYKDVEIGPVEALSPSPAQDLLGIPLETGGDVVDSGRNKSEKGYIFSSSPPKNFKGRTRRGAAFKSKMKSLFNYEYTDETLFRPFFTYYVTVAQLLILIFGLSVYGFGYFGVNKEITTKLVMVTSLTLQQVDYEQPQNIWFGNTPADLIRLGARFTPCMRDDPGINDEIRNDMLKEKETACCIRRDRSGCVQTRKDQCSETLSTWYTIPGSVSGSVCGQDPNWCSEPASVDPYKWPEDITKWPKCRKMTSPVLIRPGDVGPTSYAHMSCQVVGRPCCIGSYGQCEITTRDYCDFVQGTFHEDAALCSQVSCLTSVCGMLPFLRSPDKPDQIYRLAVSLFLHAGVIHFIMCAVFQFYYMMDLERVHGSLKVAVIYMASGIVGNLVSAIVVPYRADVGPSAALFGIFACYLVEIYIYWDDLTTKKQKCMVVLRSIIPVVIGVILGLTPWTDNWGHLGGLVTGFLLGLQIFGDRTRVKLRLRIFMFCLLVLIVVALLGIFYGFPTFKCDFCHHITCFRPIFGSLCDSHTMNYRPRVKIPF